jgi:hypothetical protein
MHWIKALDRRVVIAFGAVVVVVAILSGLLLLDLANEGAVWETLWNLTGEEAPLGQMRGLLNYLGNFTRRQPSVARDVVPELAQVNPYGINVFLQNEVEPAKRERQVQMIADAGFHWLRQEFPWEDIEIHGRGDFTDRRNDPEGIDAWAKYDNIVDLAGEHGLELIVRLGNPPAWSRAAGNDLGERAPPDDFEDFVNYAVAVAERYRGRVQHFEVWNEPNIYPEWGNQPANPEAYTDMLCRTYTALKAVDEDIIVISGALAPTVALDGVNVSDLVFLQRMYNAGAAGCFDVLAMQGYGLNSGPTDQRMRPTTVNFGRNQYIRDIMVANGDADKAIWISEMNWNPVPEDLDDPLRDAYGRVTVDQQARWVPLAYERAAEEWPWVGVMNYWFFKLAAEPEPKQAWHFFRMAEPDFTPLPVYGAMRDYIAAHPFEGE